MKARLLVAIVVGLSTAAGPLVSRNATGASLVSPPTFVVPMHGNVQVIGFLNNSPACPPLGRGDHCGPDAWAVDFRSDNTAVFPTAQGTIVFAGVDTYTGSSSTPNYGNAIAIDHGNGYYSIYTHLAADSSFQHWADLYAQYVKAKPKDQKPITVALADRLGTMSASGCTGCGAHLHFAVRYSAKPLGGAQALFGKTLGYVTSSVNVWQYPSAGGTSWMAGLPWPQARVCPGDANDGWSYHDPYGWCADLIADTSQPAVGSSVTLVARSWKAASSTTIAKDIAPYSLIITDETGRRIGSPCTSGATCIVQDLQTSAVQHSYTASIEYPFVPASPFGTSYAVMAYSSPVTVAWQPSLNRWDCSQGDMAAGCVTSTIAPMPTARGDLAAATGTDGRIYAFGGSNAGGYLNTVEVYESGANAWTCSAGDNNAGCTSSALRPMPTARGYLATTRAPDGKIYAIGGLNGTDALNTMEAYDTATNTWAPKMPIPIALWGPASATGTDGKIYVFGGNDNTFGGTQVVNAVEAYDPVADSWTCSVGNNSAGCTTSTIRPMPTARYILVAVTASDGKIYVIGGASGIYANTVEAYDPTTNAWTCSIGDTNAGCTSSTIEPMPTGRDYMAAAAGHDGKIYVIGGSSSMSGYLSTVEAYDPAINTWTTKASMPTARTVLAAATGPNGKIYTLGGLSGNNALTDYQGAVEAYSP